MQINTMILALKWDCTGELSSVDRGRVLGALSALGSTHQGDGVLAAPAEEKNRVTAA